MYKTCNKITELLKLGKQSFYQKFFEEQRKNPKAIWKGIHEIIYSKRTKTITQYPY